MSPLTPKQKKIAEYIKNYLECSGYPPSQEEIASAFGFRSLGTVQNYLVRLEREGIIARDRHAARGMRLLPVQSAAAELPLLGYVAAGRPIEAVESPGSIAVPPGMLGRGENFALRVQGDSMVGDGILDGDYVVVRKQAVAENGQTVVALLGGEATVKRFYRRAGRIELHPANPTMQPFVVEEEGDLRIEGVVVGVIRHCE